jgi:hypothetical protein
LDMTVRELKASLPEQISWWDLTAALSAMRTLMPGDWAMVPWISGGESEQLSVTQGDDVTEAGMLPLLRLVDFSLSASIVDMTAEDGNVSACFGRAGLQIRSNCLDERCKAHSHYDAMQPMSYDEIRLQVGMHVVMLAPRVELIDVMLPLAMRYARHVVCCYVPVLYLRQAHTLRDSFLRDLHTQGRLKLLPGSVRGNHQTDCVWLLVFATETMAGLMIQTATESVCDLLP